MPDRKAQIDALLDAVDDLRRPPLVMGVLNVTPDSFHDGGRYADPAAAVLRGLEMDAEGAEIIDVGGESTRPGAVPVPVATELARVIPVLRGLHGRVRAALSIDTRRAEVASAAIEAGAAVVNDVSGFRHDTAMPALLGRRMPVAIAMHMRGEPADMASRNAYGDLIAECAEELWSGVTPALEAGLPMRNVVLDPGIGFAKDWRQSLAILAGLDGFCRLGRPVAVGVSRKSFLGQVTGRTDPGERLFGTAAAVALAVYAGARIVRVHDVASMLDVVRVAHAVLAARRGPAREVAA